MTVVPEALGRPVPDAWAQEQSELLATLSQMELGEPDVLGTRAGEGGGHE